MSKNNTPYIDWFRKEYVGENGYVDCHGEVLLDDITKTIESERERVIGEILDMLKEKPGEAGWSRTFNERLVKKIKLLNTKDR